MHRTIAGLSLRIVDIRAGEGRKVLLTFVYFFLAITSYYVIKPVSRALVLDDLGHRLIPYMDLICAILMGPLVTLFARFVDRVSKPRLVSLTLWGVAGIMATFWYLLKLKLPWTAAAFYVWVNIFSVLVVTLFWLVANDLYPPRDAKRLFGFIGSGGILGGVTGSSIAAFGAKLIGTRTLLLASAGILIACWLTVERLWVITPDRWEAAEPNAPKAKESFLRRSSGFLQNVKQYRYLQLLVVVVGLGKLVSTLIYYQFNPFIEQHFPSVDEKTAFTGLFFGLVNVCAFVVQFGFTSWMLRRVGLRFCLSALPMGLLGGAAGLLVLPSFWLAAATELYDHSMNYSIQNTAKEILYLPIDRSIRYKAKPFIDMVVFRLGKGLAALIGIVWFDWLGLTPRWLSLVVMPLIGVWLAAGWAVAGGYTGTIRAVLKHKASARRAAAITGDPNPGGFARKELHASLTHDRAGLRKLEFLRAFLIGEKSAGSYEALLSLLQKGEDLEKSKVEMPLRRQAVTRLARQADQESVDYLCGLLIVEEEAGLRYRIGQALAKIRMKRPRLQFPPAQIRRQLEKEMANYQRIVRVMEIYRPQPADAGKQDPVMELLDILSQESVEQIFRLLMLIYRPDDIHLIYEQLDAADPHLRSDALELLDNVIDPSMRRILRPLLESQEWLQTCTPGASSVDDRHARALHEAIWDHNRWLSVAALMAVGRMGEPALRAEIERALERPVPAVAEAARMALRLSKKD